MATPFLRRKLLLLLLCVLPLLALAASDAVASRGTKACRRDPRSAAPYFYCHPADLDQPCGTDWKCTVINVWNRNVDPPRIVGSDCACYDVDKTIWSYLEALLSVGTRSVQQDGPLLANTSTPFHFQYAASDSLCLVYTNDIQADGTANIYQLLAAPADVGGNMTLTLGNGPPDSIPAHITALNMTIRAFSHRGRDTGPNQVLLGAGGQNVLGKYDSNNHVVTFEDPIPCTWISQIYPGGHAMMIRPIMALAGGGSWKMAPSAYADFLLPPMPAMSTWWVVALVTLLLGTGLWLVVRMPQLNQRV